MNQITTTEFARRIRILTAEIISRANSSHIGSCFSMADIIAVLYNEILNVNPQEPMWRNRDRFILSKGHACAIVYSALAERGFISRDALNTFGDNGSDLMAHISHKVPGVEFSTGSLGHGLPFAVGKALAAKASGGTWRTYVLVGDGELDEGSNWEALLFASHHGLRDLTVIVDVNNLQSLTTTDLTLDLRPLDDKLRSFGADVISIDGHSLDDLRRALEPPSYASDAPRVVLARTVKGKGVDFMENKIEWHYRSPDADQMIEVRAQLGTAP